ncbi:MAG TPA: TraR/DksA family transcriptional regulator [Steroidobacteraceae bacterium]|nr:TraR/DksA family transcriptional regulator [Steroidobacteraceae bacterium]
MPSLLTQSDRQQFEQRLRERRIALRIEIREALLRAGNERYADIAGRLQDAQDQSLAGLLADVTHADIVRDAEEISDVEGALTRLAEGRFGECTKCGARIPRARLNVYPTAKRCLPCQQAHEQARRRTTAI